MIRTSLINCVEILWQKEILTNQKRERVKADLVAGEEKAFAEVTRELYKLAEVGRAKKKTQNERILA